MGDILNLKLGAKSKAFRAEQNALNAIESMLAAGDDITFYGVAKKANVSTNYLYNNTKLRSYITRLRDDKNVASKYDKEKIAVLDVFMLQMECDDLRRDNVTLKRRLNEIEKENAVLKKYLKIINESDSDESDKENYPVLNAPF